MQTELFKRQGSCIYKYIVSLFKFTVVGGAGWVLPQSLLGFHHCLKETSLLPDKKCE